MKDIFVLRNTSLDRKISLNTVFLLVFRIVTLTTTFILVPLLIDYLDTKLYGMWLTILSVTVWINYFDIGIGNGLRNKLAETLALGDTNMARSLVSTAYILLSSISVFALAVFLSVSGFVNWARIFNVEASYNAQLHPVMIVVVVTILINFVLSLNNSVAYANQEASFPGLRQLVSTLLLFVAVLVLLATSRQGDLLSLAFINASASLSSNLALSIYLFAKHKTLIPSHRFFSLKCSKPLISLGVQFFVIQMAVLVIFATDNLIITHILGPSEVTVYNVVHKLFSPFLYLHQIIMAPLWSAFTIMYAKTDLGWIKRTLARLNMYTLLFASSIAIIILLSKHIILLWLGNPFFCRFSLTTVMGLYTLIMLWNNSYAYFLNGIGKVRLQLYTAVAGGGINIPVSIFLAKNLGLGSTGVALGSIISLSLFAVAGPLQTRYVLRSKAREADFGQTIG